MSPRESEAMQVILHAGNARALAFEALAMAKSGDFQAAENKLSGADKELEQAHDVQTKLLQSEAQGAGQTASLLLAHAMDHLIGAGSEKGLIAELIEIYKRK